MKAKINLKSAEEVDINELAGGSQPQDATDKVTPPTGVNTPNSDEVITDEDLAKLNDMVTESKVKKTEAKSKNKFVTNYVKVACEALKVKSKQRENKLKLKFKKSSENYKYKCDKEVKDNLASMSSVIESFMNDSVGGDVDAKNITQRFNQFMTNMVEENANLKSTNVEQEVKLAEAEENMKNIIAPPAPTEDVVALQEEIKALKLQLANANTDEETDAIKEFKTNYENLIVRTFGKTALRRLLFNKAKESNYSNLDNEKYTYTKSGESFFKYDNENKKLSFATEEETVDLEAMEADELEFADAEEEQTNAELGGLQDSLDNVMTMFTDGEPVTQEGLLEFVDTMKDFAKDAYAEVDKLTSLNSDMVSDNTMGGELDEEMFDDAEMEEGSLEEDEEFPSEELDDYTEEDMAELDGLSEESIHYLQESLRRKRVKDVKHLKKLVNSRRVSDNYDFAKAAEAKQFRTKVKNASLKDTIKRTLTFNTESKVPLVDEGISTEDFMSRYY